MGAATISRSKTQFTNFGELQDYLGGIPAARIRLVPSPGEATEQDLLDVEAKEGRICELINGILVEKAMSSYESRLAAVLIHFIEGYLDDNDLGVVLGEAGLLRIFPGRVRAPDVSFISWKHIPDQESPDEAIASLAPDLAVEILSATNTEAEMQKKLHDYFEAGSKLVWYADPESRTVRVYTSVRKPALLSEADTLDGRRVLPGFTLPIKKWFARASRRPHK